MSPSTGSVPSPQSLRGMRIIATGMLVAMAAVFIAANHWDETWPWLGFVKAFAEAAMVGGIADWFAVTALFRHPLGLPIPHTAIIPRNKDRIGDDPRLLPARQFPHPVGGRPAHAQRRRRRRDRPLPRQPAARGPRSGRAARA